MNESQIVRVTGMSNEEFLNQYAAPGRVGLSGGSTWIDRAIRAAERHLDAEHEWSRFSHVFVCQGRRIDGDHWVMESDIQLVRKHISLGVQENHARKYHDEELYHTLAVLDFGLDEARCQRLLAHGLGLIAGHTRYSVRELFGTWLALRRPGLRANENRLAREQSLYCSAFVKHLFDQIGLEFAPGINVKNTTPEDIFRSSLPHTTYLLERTRPQTKLVGAAVKLRNRIRARKKAREERA